ncbi:hypothetical protein V5799_033615 [Amblyomma americanum]|uniref:Major facilitator superfamily (MFS) profile domain-containing protein n=1 Tax=Amblyomma americanum TaxID=6943 RepID=A0AAQ4DMT2_AMBAM
MNTGPEADARLLRVLDELRASEPFLGSAATPKAQSVCGDLPSKPPVSSEKEHDANQTPSTGTNALAPTSQAQAGTKDRSFLPVLLAACIASLGGILFGYDSGIISGALLQLRETFDLSCVVQQLVVGSLFLSAFVASFFGGVLVDHLGRKRALLLASTLFLTGSALQSLSTGLAILVTGRFITGAAVSLSTTAQCTYIAEISPPAHRGLLMSLNEVGITVGFLLAYTVNYAFISYDNGWQLMFAAATCPALLQLLGTLFLPQSPHFLVLKGRHQEAQKVLNVIHGEIAASQELNRMQKSLLEEQNYRYRDLFAPGMRGRMIIGVGLVILQQCTGQTNVIYYAPTLLKHLGFCTNIAATLASVGLGVVKVAAALFALLFLDRLGRRVCLCSGVLLMAVSIFALGILAKFSYGGSGHVIALRCRDRGSIFNSSMSPYSYASPASDVTAATQEPIHSLHLSTPSLSRRYRREYVPEGSSFDSSALDTLPSLPARAPATSSREVSRKSEPASVGYTIGYGAELPRIAATSPPSGTMDHLLRSGQTRSSAQDSTGESESEIPREDDGARESKPSVLRQQYADEDGSPGKLSIELLAQPIGARTAPTIASYSLGDVHPSSDVLGKASITREGVSAAVKSEGARASDTADMKTSTSSYDGPDGADRSEAKAKSGRSRTLASSAAAESQCSGVPQGSAVQRALTLTALMCYVFAYGVSFGTTTWLILSEIFPAAVRGRAISVATSANWAANMTVSACFLTVLDALGIGDTLLMYSGVCVLALCFIFLCVPETKHKSLEEISEELDQGLVRWRTLLPTGWCRASDYTLRGAA